MKSLPIVFCGLFATLALSWAGILWQGQKQLGGLQPMSELYAIDPISNAARIESPQKDEPRHPEEPVGLAQQGKAQYISLGCVYCHTQQVRSQGRGADFERGWGNRQSVPRDYIRQERVLLGSSRTGPDLADFGQRIDSVNQLHAHLYNPQSEAPGSTMPPYAFLYQKRKIALNGEKSAGAIEFRDGFGPAEGYEIVPTRRAVALAAYLQSLKLDYSLPEARLPEKP